MHPSLTVSAGLALAALTAWTPAQSVGGGLYAQFQHLGENANAQMGYSVARAGDTNADGVEDYIVGAIGVEVGGLANVGAAYLYSGADGSLLRTFPGVAENGNFGFCVDAASDVNNDGYDDVIIGAPYVSPPGSANEGRAYVYSGFDGKKLYRFDGRSSEDRLGFAVAGAGDVNGDGFDDVLVTSLWCSESGFNQAGCVDLYSGANGSILRQWKGGQPNNYFGYSIAGPGDTNADGTPDVMIGVPTASPNGQIQAGRVFVYSGSDGSRLHRIDGAAPFDWFGFSLSAAGDVNFDGYADFYVGAPLTDANGKVDAGSTYLYSGKNANLLLQQDGAASGDAFGTAVNGGMDIDNDSIPDLITGATGADHNGQNSVGTAIAASGLDGSIIYQYWGANENDFLGHAVALLPDLNQNPMGEMLIGAPLLDVGPFIELGWAAVVGYSPYLFGDGQNFSAAAGGVVTFSLQFPEEFAQANYRLLGSATGMGPTNLGGIDIPLTAGDFLWDELIAPNPPSYFKNSIGKLNANAEAQCLLTLPPGAATSYVGNSFYFAAALYTPPAEGLVSSAAVVVTIVP
ncbi:MAG: FG-GAP repeat protein [Planctomycetes bacterium]|nr:FG-GAP repeat protein [Planctomycetota bacterium]